MNDETLEKICHGLRRIIMKPLTFQNVKLTIIDVHAVYYNIYEWEVPRHSHPWYEFIYITNGSFITNFKEKERVYSAGNAFLISPGAEHSHRPNGTDLSTQLCIRFQLSKNGDNDAFYDELVNLFSRLELITSDLNFELLAEKVSTNSTYRLISGIWDWLLQLCEGSFSGDNQSVTQTNAVVYQANLYIEKYYMEKINAEKIAQLLNVSYRTLARHFKSETGITINKKINDVRLNHAKTLLLNSDESIHDIALQVGYSDEFYFSNLFKKEIDLSPLAFRKKFKKSKESSDKSSDY